MGRSEPCILYAQTFAHSQLDEYVDEVIFAEPVIITACEFLEQNASSTSQAVSLVGATSPPSFALEVFVKCEGESKFKRLCNPFLYSPSAPYPLEVEAVVTNHLVVRGSYRSLSLVIYGNIVKDLGQYNILLEGRSVTDLVSSAEGNLEDLPLVLHSINRTIEECVSSLDILSLPVAASDVPIEIKQLLQLMLKILELPDLGDLVNRIVNSMAVVSSSYVTYGLGDDATSQENLSWRSKDSRDSLHVVIETKKELLDLYNTLQHQSQNTSFEPLSECNYLDAEPDLLTSKYLVEVLSPYFHFKRDNSVFQNQLTEGKNIILGLSVALLLCSGRESCFQFVNAGGMDQLLHLFTHDVHKSTAMMLLLLEVVEQATRHSFGCEGFLGWWPREDGDIPSRVSEGYSLLLKLLMQKPSHDVASLATYILHRLRVYEVASRYESAVLSLLGGLCDFNGDATLASSMLINIQSQLKKLMKLMSSCGTIKDFSPTACARRALIHDQGEGLLSYKTTAKLIDSSDCCFTGSEIDSHLLGLLKERGFLPLSAALLSTPVLRSGAGDIMNALADISLSFGVIILSLLYCRSGLNFLLDHPQLTATVIQILKGSDDLDQEQCVPLRYATALTSKGFTCTTSEVGVILEMHLRVVSAIDRLLKSTPQTEEFLWVLWELCGLSRSDCGRQALLALCFFPEAIAALMEPLNSIKEMEPPLENSGASPLNLAIFHSIAEIFEVIVSDSSVLSLRSWIGHAMELHKALDSSSPGSNRKDAPARLLTWIDTGVIYNKNGAIGLLRYAAVLASGGDANVSSASILALDLVPAENTLGESSSASEINVLENLGKIVSEKSFDGVTLPDPSIAQLTTALRILAIISENSSVAAALYDEGATTVIYAVIVNCSFMLERSSNIYDYLVDDDHECSSISDFLLERNREQSIVDLLIPSLILLISLLQKLQEAKEQHRNTKLVTALLRLHREVSPKLAACAADLSSSYPDSALGFGAVCHLIASALACWPAYGWTPGLFHSILSSVQTSSLLALGPKETCSLLCLLNNLFPEETVSLWKNGMPLLSGLRKLAVGTLLGPQKERQVNWYLAPGHRDKLVNQLTPHLEKIAELIVHCAVSALEVIQDMVRVFIIRIACRNGEHAFALLRPTLSWIRERVSDFSFVLDADAFKVYRFLDFLARLLEHPCAKPLLLEGGFVQIVVEVLGRCYGVAEQTAESSNSAEFSLSNWSVPVFKSISLLCKPRASVPSCQTKELFGSLSTKDCSSILPYILKFCQVLPAGKELLSCLTTFKVLVTCHEGQNALLSAVLHFCSSFNEADVERGCESNGNLNPYELDWKKKPPLLCCLTGLLRTFDSQDGLSTCAIEAVKLLCLVSLGFCMDGKSLDLNKVAALKCLFGLPNDMSGIDSFPEENINLVQELTQILSSKITNADSSASSDDTTTLYQASELANTLLLLLQHPSGTIEVDNVVLGEGALASPNIHFSHGSAETSDYDLYLGLGDKFCWEFPETLPDRMSLSTLSLKRKMPSAEGPNRRAKGDNSLAEISTQNTMSRGMGPSAIPSGPSRRDTFRQRKPNTSRPPSMHVDDYVARERNVDGVGNSNAITIPRSGSTSGRPPSIHVDEFMARERGRQTSVPIVVGEAATQVKNAAPSNDRDTENTSKPKQLKADLEDDLHGIEIVFDGEESESDDRLPFPQPDDNLPQPAPVVAEQGSPRSIVEETESDANGSSQFMGTPVASNVDENTQSEFSSRMSVSRPEMSLTREASISSDKKFSDQSAAVANSTGFPSPVYNNAAAASMHMRTDSRAPSQNLFIKNGPQHGSNVHNPRGLYDQKSMPSQPPLPPMPPPSSVSHGISQTLESVGNQSSPFVNRAMELQPPFPGAFQGQPDYQSSFNNSHMPESKHLRANISSPAGSVRPPISSNAYNMLPPRTSTSQPMIYNQGSTGTGDHPQSSMASMVDSQLGMTSYPPPPLMPNIVFNRPGSIPIPFYGGMPPQQQGDNLHIPQLQPMQQLQRPLQPPQHLRPPIQNSQSVDQGMMSLQNPVQVQMHPLQMPQVSSVQAYYQQSQQLEISQVQQQQLQQQVVHQQGSSSSQQQQESGMSLHEYFKSPEAIQSLLSDRDKLCQLLEQHPKLMQMLQEKLGHL